MSVLRRRILIGRIFHESHSFNPRPTDEAGFRVQRGPALLSDLGGSTSILAGIARRLGDLQDVVVPSVSAVAAPGGLVDHRCYLALKDELIAAAGESACEAVARSEEHTSELQSLMRISYAVFCLKKKKKEQHPQIEQQ